MADPCELEGHGGEFGDHPLRDLTGILRVGLGQKRNELLATNPRHQIPLAQVAARRPRQLYVIRNGTLAPSNETTARSTMKIAGRAISTLIQYQGIGDLYRLYLLCKRDGIDYNVSWMPASFTEKLKGPFDQAYMQKLYAVGRAEMLDGRAWAKLPPGFDPRPFQDI